MLTPLAAQFTPPCAFQFTCFAGTKVQVLAQQAIKSNISSPHEIVEYSANLEDSRQQALSSLHLVLSFEQQIGA